MPACARFDAGAWRCGGQWGAQSPWEIAAYERTLARIFHEFEMFIGKASGVQLYDCYRKPPITQPMDISGSPAG